MKNIFTKHTAALFFAILTILPGSAFAYNSYVTDLGSGKVYAIDTATNAVTAEVSNTFTAFSAPTKLHSRPMERSPM